MNLFEIQRDLIADRAPEAWYRINVAGPWFHYRHNFGYSADGPFSYVQSEHRERAVCREEPALTMSWGMPIYDNDRESELQFDWADTFVDSTVHPFWVDFFWHNGLIDRVELCSVDGGHGTIPILGHRRRVSEFDEAVAFLVHGLENGAEHDNPGRYLDALNAVRVHDTERWGAGSPKR